MQKDFVYLYTSVSGNAVGYTTYTFGSGAKKLYIQGGVHGGEVTYFVFKKLFDFLKEREASLLGQITLAPIINPRSWEQRVYYYTVGKFDLYKGKDWNRGYRANPETDLSARMSAKIFGIAKEYPICIDLHTARASRPYTIVSDAESLPYAKQMGLPYTLFIEPTGKYAGTFNDACAAEGIFSLTCECGSHDSHSISDIGEVVRGLYKIIESTRLSSVETIQAITTDQYITDQVKVVYAQVSGFVEYALRPRDAFKTGDLLFRLYDAGSLEVVHEVSAPCDGIAFELAKTHVCLEGDEIVRYLPKENLRTFDVWQK